MTWWWVLWAFFLHYSRLAAGEAGNPKMPMGTQPQKSLLSLSKGPRKEQPHKSESFKKTETALLQTDITENTVAASLPNRSENQVKGLYFLPSQATVMHPKPCWMKRRPSKKLELSSLLSGNEPLPTSVSGEWNLDFTPTQQERGAFLLPPPGGVRGGLVQSRLTSPGATRLFVLMEDM